MAIIYVFFFIMNTAQKFDKNAKKDIVIKMAVVIFPSLVIVLIGQKEDLLQPALFVVAKLLNNCTYASPVILPSKCLEVFSASVQDKDE